MAKIKLTKNELKTQRDALARYRRFLPTLQLKKQSLQMEVRRLARELKEKKQEEDRVRAEMSSWVKLFAEPFDFSPYVALDGLVISRGNVVGVSIPVLEELRFPARMPDPRETPAWTDEGVRMLRRLIRLRVEREVVREQHLRLAEELRTTTQRVNLFEKVKIPESRENIRRIQIFLGDEQTAAVARAKIAKTKTREREAQL